MNRIAVICRSSSESLSLGMEVSNDLQGRNAEGPGVSQPPGPSRRDASRGLRAESGTGLPRCGRPGNERRVRCAGPCSRLRWRCGFDSGLGAWRLVRGCEAGCRADSRRLA